jgi:hypothetical protein
MAKLYVTEFSDQGQTVRGPAPAARIDTYTEQTPVVIGAGSLQSATFAATTLLVRLETDSICSIAFSTNPTATANTMRMNANDVEYFTLTPGTNYKVAVIANT